MAVAVVVDVASGRRLLGIGQRLLCGFTDRDFVLRDRGLRCGLLGFRWRSGSVRLGLGIHCGNGLNWIAHGYHLTPLLSAAQELTLARAPEKGSEPRERFQAQNKKGSPNRHGEPFPLFPIGYLPMLLSGGVCGKAFLHTAREVRNDSQHPLDEHQLASVVHFMLLHR